MPHHAHHDRFGNPKHLADYVRLKHEFGNIAFDTNQKIGWFNITMNNTVVVSALQSCRRL